MLAISFIYLFGLAVLKYNMLCSQIPKRCPFLMGMDVLKPFNMLNSPCSEQGESSWLQSTQDLTESLEHLVLKESGKGM